MTTTTSSAVNAENRTALPGTLAVGEAIEDWTGDARFFEYSQAADPIGAGVIAPVPAVTFSPDLHASGPSRVVPLDLSVQLGTPCPTRPRRAGCRCCSTMPASIRP